MESRSSRRYTLQLGHQKLSVSQPFPFENTEKTFRGPKGMTPELLEIHIPGESIILPWLPQVVSGPGLCQPAVPSLGEWTWMALEGSLNVSIVRGE